MTASVWRRFTLWPTAILLVAGGAGLDVLAILASRLSWLQQPGTAAVGAGLAVIVSRVSSQEAIRESYCKEANLMRKMQYYVPLHTDIKKIRDTLLAARAGERGRVLEIGVAAPLNNPLSGFSELPGPDGGTLWRWIEFRSDSRLDNFTPRAQEQLDAAVSGAEMYNAAVVGGLGPLRASLQRHLCQAIARTQGSREFTLWARNPDYISLPADGPSSHWYTLLCEPAESLSEKWAQWWLPNPNALLFGWLLSASPAQAAKHLYSARAGGETVFPPESWLRTIFGLVCQDEEAPGAMGLSNPVYDVFSHITDAELAVFAAVEDAEGVLARGIRGIRDRYEGGQPPI